MKSAPRVVLSLSSTSQGKKGVKLRVVERSISGLYFQNKTIHNIHVVVLCNT